MTRAVRLGAAAVALAVIATGWAIRRANGGLGTATPPFVPGWSPRIEIAGAVVAVLVLLVAVALGPRLLDRRLPPLGFSAASYALALCVGTAVNLAREGTDGWSRMFTIGVGAFHEGPNEYLPGLPTLGYGVHFYLDRFAEMATSQPVNVAGHPPGPAAAHGRPGHHDRGRPRRAVHRRRRVLRAARAPPELDAGRRADGPDRRPAVRAVAGARAARRVLLRRRLRGVRRARCVPARRAQPVVAGGGPGRLRARDAHELGAAGDRRLGRDRRLAARGMARRARPRRGLRRGGARPRTARSPSRPATTRSARSRRRSRSTTTRSRPGAPTSSGSSAPPSPGRS